jgi:hypothetical protein
VPNLSQRQENLQLHEMERFIDIDGLDDDYPKFPLWVKN